MSELSEAVERLSKAAEGLPHPIDHSAQGAFPNSDDKQWREDVAIVAKKVQELEEKVDGLLHGRR